MDDVNSTMSNITSEQAYNDNNTTTTSVDEGDDNNSEISIGILPLILFRLTALISVICAICSCMETYMIIRNDQHNKMITYRILNIIACCQIIGYLAYAAGTNPAPMGTIWGAIGNRTTCQIQGFISFSTLPTALCWDALLSWTYVAMVKYNWPSWRLQKLYRYAHFVVWPIAMLLAIPPIPLDSYNLEGPMCTYSVPLVCEEGEKECEHPFDIIGVARASIAQISVLFSILCMVLLYLHVRHLENKNKRYYSGMLAKTKEMRHSRKVGIQGIMYASTVLIAFMPVIVRLILLKTQGEYKLASGVMSMLTNLYSLWYLLLFMRERQEMKTPLGRFLRRIIFGFCCRCCCWSACLVFCKTTRKNIVEGRVAEMTAVSHTSVIEELQKKAKDKQSKSSGETEELGSSNI